MAATTATATARSKFTATGGTLAAGGEALGAEAPVPRTATLTNGFG